MTKNLYARLAVTNIKNNAKTYIPYVVASVMTIMIHYIMGMLYRDAGMVSLPASDSMILMIRLGSHVVEALHSQKLCGALTKLQL